ncbi:MAG: OmpA family protein, partial [Thermodesulfobacteriota bacterium]
MKRDKLMLVFPVLVLALFYLASCATPPPTQELADAEAAVAAAKEAGCPACAPEECAAAESALAKGKALAGEFCSELEARRLLIDAKAKADEARAKCQKVDVPPPPGTDVDIALRDIFFDFDRSNIRPDAEPVLQENAEVLKNNPGMTIVIEGYADIRGSDAYNLGLAQRRADSAKAYLVSLGVDPSRIQITSQGETTKFAAGSTEDAYQLNRRAQFVPVNPGAAPGARIFFKFN